MPRNKTLKRGRAVPLRVVPILLASAIGYVIGGANTTALRTTEVSAAEAVSLRFPDHWDAVAPATGPSALTAAMNASAANTASQAQLALLSPEPTIPQAAIPQGSVQTAALERPASSQSAVAENAPAPAQAPPSATAQAPGETHTRVIAERRRVVNRPGYMLDDAQIASIKERLNLTPDQEEMWPAVEAALRNMHYTHLQEAHVRGVVSGNKPIAAVDPNTVQGLKSAAVPLIMSFNAEQKEEVRNIAHVMGLDQLASQF